MSPQELKDQKLRESYRALLLLLARKPMPDISVTELCQQAGVSRTYFYNHFGNFDEIILAAQEQEISRYLRELPNFQQVDLIGLMTRYFELAQREADNQLLLVKNGKIRVLITTFQQVYRRLLAESRILAKAPLTVEDYYIEFFAGAVINLSVTWLERGMPESPRLMGQKASRFLLRT
ncbi:TetR/AcrR family transcriptional regulator [Levilactobacillus brevis]|uniref:TetR/AcrR family transcriptional regulator n=1 Tax=Levilactobacillus brevis TaxID=1580 RepID=UPI00111E44DF|nr:TetR/AcrR family transcriptional regulator [Levilactobacillus brevis]TOY86105.1 TetR/AcrR family transcriptional regulator [Levilactobacillus brevis]